MSFRRKLKRKATDSTGMGPNGGLLDRQLVVPSDEVFAYDRVTRQRWPDPGYPESTADPDVQARLDEQMSRMAQYANEEIRRAMES